MEPINEPFLLYGKKIGWRGSDIWYFMRNV